MAVRRGPAATAATAAVLAPLLLAGLGAADRPCLCLFDIDRTLTGKQGDLKRCPWNKVHPGVTDTAYGGGVLTLSDLAQHVEGTFCSQCYLGIISAGDASGDESEERKVLHRSLGGEPNRLLTDEWQSHGCTPVRSPLVTFCPDGQKHTAVPGIIAWYKKYALVEIADEDVHFYDDRVVNINSFRGTDYNAHQISCRTRDLGDNIGLCGADVTEIVRERGVVSCEEKQRNRQAWRERYV